MSEKTCRYAKDNVFGPAVAACRRDFDFTVLFEDSILCAGPAAIFILAAIVRFLVLRTREDVARRGSLYTAKLIVCLLLGGIQAGLLVKTALSSPTTQSAASIPAAVLAFTAAGCICVLSYYEHIKTYRPSSVLILFVLATILLDAARTRTYFLTKAIGRGSILLASIIIKLVLLLIENKDKRGVLLLGHRDKASEELAGPINRTLFHWLNDVLQRGYKNTLQPADITSIDHRLYSRFLSAKFLAINRLKQGTGPYRNLLLTCKCLGSGLLRPILPRLAVTGFTFAQPFLPNSMLRQLDHPESSPISHGYGLIGATALIYLGIAVAYSWYWHQVYRSVVTVRGGLSLAIFEKLLRVPEDKSVESRAMTLMFSDVQRIMSCLIYLHEVWAGLLETGLATWLLYGQMGAASLGMLALAVAIGLACLWASRQVSPKQQHWLEAVERRLSATIKVLGSLKAVKMLAAEKRIAKALNGLRIVELIAAWPVRGLTIVATLLSYVTMTISPPLVFALYLGIAGPHADFVATKMFTSLTLIALLSTPLTHMFQALPSFGAAYGCFKRIHMFLEAEEHKDPRTVQSVAPLPSEPNEKQDGSLHTCGDIILSATNASFSWVRDGQPVLSNVTLSVKKGMRTAIIGPTGCGKSLLLKGLLGEAIQVAGQVNVMPETSFSYCAQTPWFDNVSGERNLTQYTNEPADSGFYQDLISLCELEDVIQLPDYKTGTVGSNGARLSGGQRQRLALARVVSLRRDVLVMDDVFSALDAKTKRSVANKILRPAVAGMVGQYLTKATIVYVTHDEEIAGLADEVYEIDDSGHLTQRSDLHYPRQLSSSQGSSPFPEADMPTEQDGQAQGEPQDPSSETTSPINSRKRLLADRTVYKDYLLAMGGFNAGAFLLLGMVLAVTLKFPDVWVQMWSDASKAAHTSKGQGYWLGIYAMLGVLPLMSLTGWLWHIFYNIVPAAGLKLHERILQTVLSAPFPHMSRVDSGSIINRFNQDLMLIDSLLPFDLLNTTEELFVAIVQVVLIALASVQTLSLVPCVVGVLYLIQRFYLRTSKQLRLLELEAKEDLHTKISNIAGGSGLSTTRAHLWQDIFRADFMEKLDRSQEPVYLLYSIQRWLQLVLNLVVVGLVTVVAGVAVALRGRISAGTVGVAFVNATTLGETLTQLIIAWTSLETSLGAVARVSLFQRDTPIEDGGGEEAAGTPLMFGQTGGASPEAAAVRLENIWATYNETTDDMNDGCEMVGATGQDQPWSLRGVSLEISPGERVTVCGRTGSGKSTLLLALLRMVYVPVGDIWINGVNQSHMTLDSLRSAFHVISQDRLQEIGRSVREHVDPEGHFPDDKVREALADCGIWDCVQRGGGLVANADDCVISAGETQLLSVARTILHSSPGEGGIVLLDEATSSVDLETERKVEEVIDSRLRGKTIIAIRHRLEAALNKCDRVVVMDRGRIIDVGPPGVVAKRCDIFSTIIP